MPLRPISARVKSPFLPKVNYKKENENYTISPKSHVVAGSGRRWLVGRKSGRGDAGQGAMAASKSFSFEERDESVLESSKATLAPGSVPDFESFGAIDLGAVSPAIGVLEPGAAAYKPMSKGHEYIFDEEEKTRTFGEHLVFYTGAAYLSGGAPPPWRAARCLHRARGRY